MYTAKIINVISGEDLLVQQVEATFTSGETTITKSFDYSDFQFKTQLDIMNMLQAECDILDEREARLSEIKSLVNVEDVVTEIKKSLPVVEEAITE